MGGSTKLLSGEYSECSGTYLFAAGATFGEGCERFG